MAAKTEQLTTCACVLSRISHCQSRFSCQSRRLSICEPKCDKNGESVLFLVRREVSTGARCLGSVDLGADGCAHHEAVRTLALEALTTPTCASAAPLNLRSLKPGSHAEERYGLRAVTLCPLSILALRTLRRLGHGMDLLRFASYSNRLPGFRTLSLLGYVFPGGLLLMSSMLPSFPSVHPNHNTLQNKSFGGPKNHISSAVSIFSHILAPRVRLSLQRSPLPQPPAVYLPKDLSPLPPQHTVAHTLASSHIMAFSP
jgi:hypothetical protein